MLQQMSMQALKLSINPHSFCRLGTPSHPSAVCDSQEQLQCCCHLSLGMESLGSVVGTALSHAPAPTCFSMEKSTVILFICRV